MSISLRRPVVALLGTGVAAATLLAAPDSMSTAQASTRVKAAPAVAARPANSIVTCNPWQISAHTKSRECLASSGAAVQYDDYGSDDGWCVQPMYYAAWEQDYESVGLPAPGLAAEVDCTQNSVTTVYIPFWSDVSNIVAYRVKPTGRTKKDFNTTCLSTPASPSFVSGKPKCF